MKGLLFFLFFLVFCSIHGQKNLEIIQHYLSNQIDNESIRKQNFKDLLITDESYSSQIEADHIYVNQTFEGIEILNSGGVFVIKNNKVVYSKVQLITDLQNKIVVQTESTTLTFPQGNDQAIKQIVKAVKIELGEAFV